MTSGTKANPAGRTSRSRLIGELALVVLPLLLLVLMLVVAEAHGPFHLSVNIDPDYAYLFNSISVAEFSLPWSVQHPGIPVLMLGAAVVRVGQVLNGLLGEWEAAVYPALRHHNEYLAAMAWTQILLFAGLCYLAGRRILRLTRSLWPALALQAAPFISWISLRYAYRVSPELMQMIAGLALLWTIAPMTLGERTAERARDRWRALLTGVLLAVGMATKYHFVVAGWLIFLFPGFKQKARVIKACLGSLFVLLLPVYERFSSFRGFIGEKLEEAGGDGAVTSSHYLADVARAIQFEPVVTWSLILYMAIGIALVLAGRRGREARAGQLTRIMWIGAAIVVSQLVLISLRVRPHYYITALAFVFVMMPHVVEALRRLHPAPRIVFAAGLLAIVLPAYRTTAIHLPEFQRVMANEEQNYVDIAEQLREIPECISIGYYPSSMPSIALSFGNDLSGRHYGRQLEESFPGVIVYNPWSVDFLSWESASLWRQVEERVAEGGCVLLSGRAHAVVEIAGFQAVAFHTPREGAPGDAIFQLSLDAATPALLTGDRAAAGARILEAEQFRDSNAVTENTGRIGVLTSTAGPTFAEYAFQVERGRRHSIRIRYASGETRPMRLVLNGETVLDTVCHAPTGGDEAKHMKWHVLGPFPFREGGNMIRLESDGQFPKIDRIALRELPY